MGIYNFQFDALGGRLKALCDLSKAHTEQESRAFINHCRDFKKAKPLTEEWQHGRMSLEKWREKNLFGLD